MGAVVQTLAAGEAAGEYASNQHAAVRFSVHLAPDEAFPVPRAA